METQNDLESIRWRKYYDNSEFHLDYPRETMYEAVKRICRIYPEYTAIDFMGGKVSYRELYGKICEVAAAFSAAGIGKRDVVTLNLPNIPQAVYCIYALNKIGAVPSMIHPLSAETEILRYLEISESKAVVVTDMFYAKTAEAVLQYKLRTGNTVRIIIASIADELNFPKNIVYNIMNRRNTPKIRCGENVLLWRNFIGEGKSTPLNESGGVENSGDAAVILYSGGTTGTSKGIVLTDGNINAVAAQTLAASGFLSVAGDKMLSIMPVFHGFGLGIGIHLPLVSGACCILVPRFSVKTYANLIKRKKPNFIPGVPTIFEALLRAEGLEKTDLSFLKGVFSGGDSLSPELKKKVDAFLKAHNAKVQIREGYGTTECVTASCLTPPAYSREGSIGLPFPDTYFAIIKVGTTEHLPYGEEGEICLRGPTVMSGYLGNPEETAQTLRTHDDGNVWLHTGDLGFMDEDGFVYFRQRIKRMIVTSGYNVYPSRVENVIDGYPKVQMSCVIGVKDAYKMHRVKAFVMLKQGVAPSDELKNDIIAHCRRNIARYAVPSEIEFRKELPTTLVGKVDYRKLEEEEEGIDERQPQR